MDKSSVKFIGNVCEMAIAQCIASAVPSALVLSNLKFYCRYLKAHETEVDIVVITDHAIYSIESKDFPGYLTGEFEEYVWAGKARSPRVLNIHNPVHQNMVHIRFLRKFLYDHFRLWLPIGNCVVVPESCVIHSECPEVMHTSELYHRLCEAERSGKKLPLAKEVIYREIAKFVPLEYRRALAAAQY